MGACVVAFTICWYIPKCPSCLVTAFIWEELSQLLLSSLCHGSKQSTHIYQLPQSSILHLITVERLSKCQRYAVRAIQGRQVWERSDNTALCLTGGQWWFPSSICSRIQWLPDGTELWWEGITQGKLATSRMYMVAYEYKQELFSGSNHSLKLLWTHNKP